MTKKKIIIFLERIRRVNVLDYVRYKGKTYLVNNMVRYPYLDLCELKISEDGYRESLRVHINEVKKYYGIHNIKVAMWLVRYLTNSI